MPNIEPSLPHPELLDVPPSVRPLHEVNHQKENNSRDGSERQRA
jgi:hypothetical protein